MAFSFLDLFPDTPAAVAAAKGAREILENQDKQAMDFLALEDALLKTAAAHQKQQELERLKPLSDAVSAIKLIQGVNATGTNPFEGLDLQDPDSLRERLTALAQEGAIKTDLEAELLKQKAMTEAALSKSQALERSRAAQDKFKEEARQELKIRELALNRADELIKQYRRTPKTPSQIERLVSDYRALLAYGVPEAARIVWSKHSGLLAAAGFPSPGARLGSMAEENKDVQKKKGVQKPIRIQSPKTGKWYIYDPVTKTARPDNG